MFSTSSCCHGRVRRKRSSHTSNVSLMLEGGGGSFATRKCVGDTKLAGASVTSSDARRYGTRGDNEESAVIDVINHESRCISYCFE